MRRVCVRVCVPREKPATCCCEVCGSANPARACLPLPHRCSQAGLPFVSREDSAAVARDILRFAAVQRYHPGDRLWEEGDPADAFFIIEQGRVTVEQQPAAAMAGGGSADSKQQQQSVAMVSLHTSMWMKSSMTWSERYAK